MKWFLSFLIMAALGLSYVYAQTVPGPQGTAAMVCANNTVVPTPSNGKFFYVQCNSAGALITNGLSGSPGQIPATTTNDNGCTTCVGYYQSAGIASGSAITMANLTPQNIGQLSLAPGDWDVRCNGIFMGGGSVSSVSQWSVSLSTTSGAVDASAGHWASSAVAGTDINTLTEGSVVGPTRYSLASTTNVYCVGRIAFSGNAPKMYGLMEARRAR